MMYAILCYDHEDVIGSWSKEHDSAVMARLDVVQKKLEAKGKLGPVARLLPTTSATTLRKGREAIIMDGPFAETKEQLLGFYLVDCDTLEEAIQIAKDLSAANQTNGSYEIRPVMYLRPQGASA
jgi:hypothetical protein